MKGLHKNSIIHGGRANQWIVEDACERIRIEAENLKAMFVSEESVSNDDDYYEGKIEACDEILSAIKKIEKL